MKTLHPVHLLKTTLESARLKSIEALSTKDGALPYDSLRELAALQTALQAVREEIAARGGRLGWGNPPDLE